MDKEIPVIFHKEANYIYHFIVKELSKEFEACFNCLEENTKQCKKYSVLIKEEEKRIDKMDRKLQKSYPDNETLLMV